MPNILYSKYAEDRCSRSRDNNSNANTLLPILYRIWILDVLHYVESLQRTRVN